MSDRLINKSASQKTSLLLTPASDETLSPAQIEFNRQMKSLGNAKTKFLKEQSRLDALLIVSSRDLMPLIENLHRSNRDFVFHTMEALQEIKFNDKRRRSLKDLLLEKASDLIGDSCGLEQEDLARLEAIRVELEPPYPKKKSNSQIPHSTTAEFDMMREIIQKFARDAGIDMDFSGLDPNMNPEDLERELIRLSAAAAAKNGSPTSQRPHKQTAAQLKKEQKLKEQEEAKKRDLKSLYKQLAKALHPDLETDPKLKEHKEVWMKRLTSAHAAGDLRELLQIEVEWLGEESSNLATAGEDKLKVYCAVLKQQISDLKRQTDKLLNEPQYWPLHRFADPIFGDLSNTRHILPELKHELRNYLSVMKTLKHGGGQRQKLLEQIADERRSSQSEANWPF